MFSMNYLILCSLVFVLTEAGVSVHNPFYCYTQDPITPQIGMFAVHTPYEAVRGQSINQNVSTCSPSKFWMLNRHGTRLPTRAELTNVLEHNERIHRDILTFYEQGRTSLCASDVELLQNWTFNPNITFENIEDLTSSGWEEMEGLAQRYKVAFPSIFSSTYSPNDYFFRPTDQHRGFRSLHAFADGLFGVNGYEQVQFEDVPVPDNVLRGSDHCPLYQRFVDFREERDAFIEGPEYQLMTSQVSEKLGFHGSHALRNIEIDVLFIICKYEQILDLNLPSPLCAALSVANHQTHEYSWDVDTYYRMGFGYTNYRRLFENLNCFLMQDMLRYLQSNDANDHKARVFSSNGPPIGSFLVTLGAFEDDVPLTRHNFAQQTQRLWKSSLIIPMAANIAVIRYDCADGDNDLLFLHNEKPLRISGCDENGLCKQSLILERFSRFLDANCAEIFCSNT